MFLKIITYCMLLLAFVLTIAAPVFLDTDFG